MLKIATLDNNHEMKLYFGDEIQRLCNLSTSRIKRGIRKKQWYEKQLKVSHGIIKRQQRKQEDLV